MRHHREDQPADDQRHRAEHAARDARRETARQHHLRNPSRQQHDGGAEHPGQHRNPARILLRKAEPLDDEGREPGQPERQRPIGAEGRGAAADKRPRCQELEIGNARIGCGHRDRLHQRSLLAHHQPRRDPHQADHAERAEGIVPAMIDDDPVQRRHRQDHAESRALRENGGRQRPLLVGKPFVDGMRRHRKRRPLAGAEDDAADHECGETDGADHRKLRHRPDRRHHEQHPPGCNAVDDEADDDGRDREQ